MIQERHVKSMREKLKRFLAYGLVIVMIGLTIGNTTITAFAEGKVLVQIPEETLAGQQNMVTATPTPTDEIKDTNKEEQATAVPTATPEMSIEATTKPTADADSSQSPTPEMNASASPSDTNAVEKDETATATPGNTPTPDSSIEPGATTMPSATPTATVSPSPSATPVRSFYSMLKSSLKSDSRPGLDMQTWIQEVVILVADKNGSFVPPDSNNFPDGKVPVDANAKVNIAYKIPDGTILTAEDSIYFMIPEQFQKLNSSVDGVVIDSIAGDESTSEAIGTYTIDTDGKLSIQFHQDYLDAHEGIVLGGTVQFEASFDKTNIGETGGKKEIYFGNVMQEITFENPKDSEIGDASIVKSAEVNAKEGSITYKLVVTVGETNNIDVEDVTVKDYFIKGGDVTSYDEESFTCSQGKVVELANDKESFIWTIGTLKPGAENVTLEYKVKVDKLNISQDDSILMNEADLLSGSTPKDYAQSTINTYSNVHLEKVNEGYDPENKTITYSMKVTADENNFITLDSLVVKDAFDANNAKYIKNVTSYQTEKEDTFTYKTSTGQVSDMQWNIFKLEPGEKRTLTYTVSVVDNSDKSDAPGDDIWNRDLKSNAGISNASNTLTNTADLYLKNGDTETKLESKYSKVFFEKKWLSKKGEFDKATNRINYTVVLNDFSTSTGDSNSSSVTNQNMYQWVITDKLTGEGAVYDRQNGVLSVTYTFATGESKTIDYDMAKILTDDTDKEFKLTVPDEYSQCKITLNYYAKPDGTVIGSFHTGNSIGVGPSGDNNTFNVSGVISSWARFYAVVNKKQIAREDNLLTWESTITTPVNSNTRFSDWVTDANKMWFDWTTYDMQISFKEQPLVENTDYRLELEDNKCFRIYFLKNFEATEKDAITITYKTTVSNKLSTTQTLVNMSAIKVTTNGKDYALVDQTSASYNYVNNLYFNKLCVNDEKGKITWRIILNANDSFADEYTIVDELPAGTAFESAKVYEAGTSKGVTVSNAEVQSNGKIQMTVSGLQGKGKKVAIDVVTEITDENYLSGAQTSFTNKALLMQGDALLREAEITKQFTYKALAKKGLQNGTKMQYTLYVNPDALDLSDGDTIDIIDEMPAQLMLLPETIVVKDADGNLVKEVSKQVDDEHNTFTITVPDEKKLTISYNATTIGEVGTQIKLVNTAYFKGYRENGSKIECPNTITIQGSGATAYTQTVYLMKMDTDGSTVLQGAQFDWYSLNPDGSETKCNTSPLTNSTAEKQQNYILLNPVSKNVIYRFEEVTAPAGYQLSGSSTYFVILDGKTTLDSLLAGYTLPDGVSKSDIKVVLLGGRFTVYNARIPVTPSTPSPGATPTPNDEPTPQPYDGTDPTPVPAVTPNGAGGNQNAVLGARRIAAGSNEAAVLGARRGSYYGVLGKRRRPATGDSMAMILWSITLAGSICAGGISVIALRKKRKNQ